MRRLMVTALCGLMVLPTLSVADDHGHAPPRNSYHQGGGQGRNDGNHGNVGGNHSENHGGRYTYYRGHDQPHYSNGYRSYNYGGYRPRYYGNPYPSYYGRSHHHDNNDDALWAIGGLMLGAIIGSAAERASTRTPATTYAAPPVARPQTYCDRVEYDSAGNPYVERRCEK